jgi:pyruvate formate lyase activating enzyme
MLMDLEPFSLIDYPGHVAAVIFFGGCNFRCGYCHNPSLVENAGKPRISSEEIYEFLLTRQGLLEGVCLTGGEPLLSPEVYDLAESIKKLGFKLKLDTNGCSLKNLEKIVSYLDYLAVDIKAAPEKYEELTKCSGAWTQVKQTADWVKSASIPHEFRTTVLPVWHTFEDLKNIREYLGPEEKWVLQQFRDPPEGVLDGKVYLKFPENELKAMAQELGCEVRGLN